MFKIFVILFVFLSLNLSISSAATNEEREFALRVLAIELKIKELSPLINSQLVGYYKELSDFYKAFLRGEKTEEEMLVKMDNSLVALGSIQVSLNRILEELKQLEKALIDTTVPLECIEISFKIQFDVGTLYPIGEEYDSIEILLSNMKNEIKKGNTTQASKDLIEVNELINTNKFILEVVEDNFQKYNDIIRKKLLIHLSNVDTYYSKFGVQLDWKSEAEIDNLGFRVWRGIKNSTSGYEPTLLKEFNLPEQVNPEPNENCSTKIQGQLKVDNSNQSPKLISAIGNSTESTCYSFTDTSNLSDGTYYYLLEDISDDGKSTFHCDYIDAVTIGQGPAIDLQPAINYCKEVTGSNN